MKQIRVLPWLLLGSIALTACGRNAASGVSSQNGSNVSEPPAQSAMAPLPQLPDSSVPAADEPDDISSISSSQEEPDAGQSPDTSQSSEPPAAEVKPTSPPPATDPQPVKPKPAPEPEPEPPVDPITEPDPQPEPEPESKPAATREAAAAYIGRSVSSLIAAIGAPNGSDYAPSCLGDGEDGELFYDGFTVYTYRVNGTETVQDVV